MPNMIFQYVLLACVPLADILLVIGLFSKELTVFNYYIAFLLLDAMVSVYSFYLEKEKKKPLVTLFIQRLVYRQFFTYVMWKSILFAIKGGLMGWNKLQRTGNVQQPVNEGNKKFVAGE